VIIATALEVGIGGFFDCCCAFCHRPCAVCNRGLRQATSNDLCRTVDRGFTLRPQRRKVPARLIEHQLVRAHQSNSKLTAQSAIRLVNAALVGSALRNMAPNQEPQRSVSVVVADDHPVVLRGITEILQAQPDISVVAACSCGKDATAAIQQFAPDVAVLDIVMPDINGLDVLSSIERHGFKTRVVILSAVATEDRVLAAMTRGAKGLLFKDAAPDNLVDCVREVASGKLWFPNDPVGAAREHAVSKSSIGALTSREREIALLVSEGLTDKLVAEQLSLAESTVKSHLHHIYKKLGIPNRTALCARARALL
jgi:DNA-binding NarL/FixJ family response regulator